MEEENWLLGAEGEEKKLVGAGLELKKSVAVDGLEEKKSRDAGGP